MQPQAVKVQVSPNLDQYFQAACLFPHRTMKKGSAKHGTRDSGAASLAQTVVGTASRAEYGSEAGHMDSKLPSQPSEPSLAPAGLRVTSTLRIRHQQSREVGDGTPSLSRASVSHGVHPASSKSKASLESELNGEETAAEPEQSAEDGQN